jgi:hypothetical protein
VVEVEAPFAGDETGDETSRGAVIGPAQDLRLARGQGAEELGPRMGAHAEEVQPVSVPTHLNAHVGGGEASCMGLAGIFQELEAGIVEIKLGAAQLASKLGAALTMSVIDRLIAAAGIVEDREEFNDVRVRAGDASEGTSVLKDAGPVRHSVGAAHGKRVGVEDALDEGRGNDSHWKGLYDGM